MRRAAVLFLVLGIPAVGRADSPAADFRVIETLEAPVNHGLRRITTTVQNGDKEINRFLIERVLPEGRNPRSLRPILISPAWGLNHHSYTVGLQPGGGDFENSFAANLARGGADVFLYSTRQALLAPCSCGELQPPWCPPPPGVPPPPPLDCSPMKEWGLQTRLNDLEFIRNQIAAEHEPVKPVIGGVSLGGLAALAAVNQHPDAYAGVILIEATIAPLSDGRRDAHLQYCGTLQSLLNGGVLFDSAAPALGRSLLQFSVAAPNEVSPLSVSPFFLFPPGTTNRQAYLLTLGTPSLGPPYSPFPARVVVVATSVPQNRLLFASEDVTASQIVNGNSYNPLKETTDITCAFGGDQEFSKKFSGNLGAFRGPVLAFEAELGLGTEMQSTLNLMGSRNIQVHFDEGFGHADLFYHPDRANRLEGTILRWLEDTEGN